MVVIKDWIDRGPGSLHGILTGEERAIAGHGVAQKPLVGRFFSRPFINQKEFTLVADELLSRALDAGSQGHGGVRG